MYNTTTAKALHAKFAQAPAGLLVSANGRRLMAKAVRLVRQQDAADARMLRDNLVINSTLARVAGA